MTHVALSKQYSRLLTRARELRKCMLPSVFSPIGTYSPEEELKTAAFVVLLHAEIEGYLEDRAEAVCATAQNAWASRGKCSVPLLSILAFSGIQLYMPPESLVPTGNVAQKQRVAELTTVVGRALAAYGMALRENHGIRERNLLGILLPVGLDPKRLDTALVRELDALGSHRGQIAHQSTASLRIAVDPAHEIARARRLLVGLRHLDRELGAIEADIGQW